MEAISLIGFASSVLSIVDIVTRTIIHLRDLQSRWKAVSLTVKLLLGQLTVLKAALTRISEWISTGLIGVVQHYQLVIDHETSLESCNILLSYIHEHLSRLRLSEAGNLSIEARIKVAFEDGALKNLNGHINNQTNALNLLLTVLNYLVNRSICFHYLFHA